MVEQGSGTHTARGCAPSSCGTPQFISDIVCAFSFHDTLSVADRLVRMCGEYEGEGEDGEGKVKETYDGSLHNSIPAASPSSVPSNFDFRACNCKDTAVVQVSGPSTQTR